MKCITISAFEQEKPIFGCSTSNFYRFTSLHSSASKHWTSHHFGFICPRNHFSSANPQAFTSKYPVGSTFKHPLDPSASILLLDPLRRIISFESTSLGSTTGIQLIRCPRQHIQPIRRPPISSLQSPCTITSGHRVRIHPYLILFRCTRPSIWPEFHVPFLNNNKWQKSSDAPEALSSYRLVDSAL